ncbi:MAG: ATP-binding protein [Lachnospiraceae bacterium]|nr:ATP-binding protein [Lachnospiraceae bacterium]
MLLERRKYIEFLLKQKDKDVIKVITGLRRSGKSTLLFQLYFNQLIKMGIQEDHIFRVALDNIRYAELKNPIRLYKEIESRIVDQNRYYIFLDEIQLVENFEDVVNGIKNDYNCDVYITGSNSKFLSSDINTKFRGRSIELRVFTLSFSEFYSCAKGDRLDAFNQYMLYGGMPYLLQEEDSVEKSRYLKMVSETVELNDIIERHGIRNVEAFKSVVNLLCSSIGSYVSSKKIADTLKSNGQTSIEHKTVSNYLDYLCDAFLFYRVERYDIKGKAYLKTQNKYYVGDIGIRNAILNFRQLEPTHTIENLVYLELLSRGYMVDIGSNNLKEIDFVAKDMKNTFYIQVSYSIVDENTREREVSSFYNLDDGYRKIIITMDFDPYTDLGRGYKKINMLDFLLDEHALEKL